MYALIGALIAIAAVVVYNVTGERGAGPRQVWDQDHGHYHTVP
jgi:hypothetical protein